MKFFDLSYIFSKKKVGHLGIYHLEKCTFGKLPLGKLHIWKVSSWEIVTWEVALGKMPFGKYLTPPDTGDRLIKSRDILTLEPD